MDERRVAAEDPVNSVGEYTVWRVPLAGRSNEPTSAWRYLYYRVYDGDELPGRVREAWAGAGRNGESAPDAGATNKKRQRRDAPTSVNGAEVTAPDWVQQAARERRVLLVVNVPGWLTAERLARAFAPVDATAAAFLDRTPEDGEASWSPGFSSIDTGRLQASTELTWDSARVRGYVCMGSAAVARAAVRHPERLDALPLIENEEESGLGAKTKRPSFVERALRAFLRSCPQETSALEREADAVVAAYEAQRQSQEAEQKAALVDDDGFTRVTRKRHRNEASTAAPSVVADGTAHAEPRTHPGFYKVDRQNARRQQLEALRTRFELDKRRMKQMRAARQPFLT
ncbi:hypothetical protein CDCA_CDCA17G4375 [Cyanidium caldarium]|uniref:Ribosomal RNA-processing protein 7 C-terminal domain-containing protein n=1 Tax=Cyanidium caldarium TaxID=2771 RepID=A0AAV9J204_CYACA|nr:hypothetical protein CDCA_CDCA17G4375 [Cyanidium caldarium]|eukprot:ctg_285.g188